MPWSWITEGSRSNRNFEAVAEIVSLIAVNLAAEHVTLSSYVFVLIVGDKHSRYPHRRVCYLHIFFQAKFPESTRIERTSTPWRYRLSLAAASYHVMPSSRETLLIFCSRPCRLDEDLTSQRLIFLMFGSGVQWAVTIHHDTRTGLVAWLLCLLGFPSSSADLQRWLFSNSFLWASSFTLLEYDNSFLI